MAGRGAPPKDESARVRSPKPTHDWRYAEAVGWQYGEIPEVPDGLMPASVWAWGVWFGAWFASFWTPEDLPGLRHVIRLYDQVERGEYQRAPELRLEMETYGITPKGQQDRRWRRPKDEPGAEVTRISGRYDHLRAVN